jgi:basic amino acid/polyamine antiporter, APA family
MTNDTERSSRMRGEESLVRALGTWGLAASIVNLTIGGGIFRLPAPIAGVLGASAPVAYLVCALTMGLIVLCFAEAGSRVSLTGGLYAFVDLSLGPVAGFFAGFMLWSAITVAAAAIASFFADALGSLVPALSGPGVRLPLLVAVLAGLAALNVVGVRGANRFNTAVTVAKLVPLVALVVFGSRAVAPANLVWHGAPPIRDVARASTILIFAFLGVESALAPTGEVRDPKRTIPRGIFIAMGGVTLIYLSIQIVAQGVLGASLARSTTPLADAAGAALGAPGRTLVLAGMVISMFGYVSGVMLAVPRMLFALGRDGYLPAPLGRVHDKYNTPYVAIIVQVVLVIGLATTGTFEQLAVLANVAALAVYAACCVAVLVLRRREAAQGGTAANADRDAAGAFRAPLGGAVPVLALAAIGWLFTSLTRSEWLSLFAIAVIAAVIYVASARARRVVPAAPEAAA